MLTLRRAMVAAAFLLTVFFLVSHSHRSSATSNTFATTTTATASSGANSPTGPAARAGNRAAAQKPLIDMSHMSTIDKLSYTYPYDIEKKFPAYIWQTWKYTPADGEFQFRDQEASWTILHPGFVHEVITDSVASSLLRMLYASVPEVLQAYEALPLPVLKADFFRYLILFARGGIYSDIDTFALQSADVWIPKAIPRESVGMVIGIEADPDRADWADWYSRRIQFCQWTIQSKPGHPILRETIARITNATLTLKANGKLSSMHGSEGVVDLTGPAVWTDTIMDYFNDARFFDMTASEGKIDFRNFTGMEVSKRVGDVVVLPITGFSPGVGQMGAKDYDDPMAFVKHDFEGTWKPESERHIGEAQDS
ncbi:initiation-specific alpha-1,6-mannosyltransferase [Cordyceps fumosorosea ARSEF 2679]|uniref:Initiation-specific alpha-1,6-mannosyltransferase n=1 Tax=Cordyceps fumosorosea (strain ARSEF 2679) TaxID=1081104 RepID=A0A167MYK9_CORFA|nr:initiation-specific alpha-1,6-mannosyltransferase [Cordyceps fumosorosea ARSEF 2679]OAA54911.1 initiation-specific alpha-1,6-mannosyltransferase [Cordyceps fumosorosea ARSEF 2679]